MGPKDSGKTKLIQLITALLGEENVSSVPMQKLSERFMNAELAWKLANFSDDSSKGRIKDSSMLKRYSGRSRILAEKKGKDPFSYINYAKLVNTSNYMPWVDDPTDADFGRFMIIQLHSKFGDPSKEDGVKPKDPTILDKLVNPREMSGLINMALDGLKRLKAQNWEFSYKLTEAEVEALMTGGTAKKRDECYALPRHVEAESGNECYPGRRRPPACHTRKDRICCAGFTILQALRCLVLGWWC